MTNAQLNVHSDDQLKIDPFSAQNWLDETYPIERRNSIKRIGHNNDELFTIFNKVPADLTGKFINFGGFDNLTELNLAYRRIELESIASFPASLQILQLASNYFPPSTLEPFSHLINLVKLDIGTFDSNDHDHNQWYGSLIYLKGMKNLNWFCGASTNLDCGLEHLPKHKFENLGFRSDFKHSKCLKLRKILKLINYDLNQFNSNFYHEDYLNASQLLHDFKLVELELKKKDNLNETEINLKKTITDLENFILIIKDKNSEIKRLSNELNNFHSQMKFNGQDESSFEKNLWITSNSEKFEADFIHNNFLLSFRKIQVFILKNKLNKLNQALLKERSDNEYLSNLIMKLETENKELDDKYREERLKNTGTLFLNSHLGAYLIKEFNKCPLVNIEESHIKSLNTALLFSNFVGYSSFQKYSIYFIIFTFAFMIFAYLLKLLTGLFFNAINFFISWYQATKKVWSFIFPKKEESVDLINENIKEIINIK